MTDELKHYGILGMKWGVRKKEPVSKEVKSAEALVQRRKTELDKSNARNKKLASLEYRYSKEDLAKTKLLEKIKKKDKSPKQLELEQEYRQKGQTPDDASISAYKNIQTRKALVALGITAAVATAAVVGYSIHDDRVDKIVKSGTKLQNISRDSTESVRDAFYASSNVLDKAKYKGLYGLHLSGGSPGTGADVFSKTITTLSEMKQASNATGERVFRDLIENDPQFAKDFKNYMGIRATLNFASKSWFGKAARNYQSGKIDRSVYTLFNSALVDHDPLQQSMTDKFYDALRSQGYGLIRDLNDSKHSGYNAINPVINFANQASQKVTNVEKLSEGKIWSSYLVSNLDPGANSLSKLGVQITSAILGVRGAIKINKIISDQDMIRSYKDEHPNTEMTNTEIIRMFERKEAKGSS